MNIGFIGCGNMAQPIISGVINSCVYSAECVYVYDTDSEKMKTFCEKVGAQMLSNEAEIALRCDCVFLCIKPQGFDALLTKIAPQLNEKKPFIVSIAAGKTTDFVADYLADGARIGRIFPNLNASVSQSASAYCVNSACNREDLLLLGKICESFGTALLYPEEMFSQFGVLGGCSPAYTFMYIDSLAKAAEKNGMARDVALKTAIQAVLGSAMFMMQSGIEPEILIDRVCSKGGTTIEGVLCLRENNFPGLVCNAYESSLRRDLELSKA